MMPRRVSLVLCSFGLSLLSLAACGGSDPAAPPPADPPRAAGPDRAAEPVAVTAEEPADAEPLAGPLPELLRGRVIDTRTAQGVGDLWVRLRRRGVECAVTTDVEGDFVADRALPEGMVSALVGLGPDGPWLEPSLFRLEHGVRPPEKERHVLRVEIGPSYPLDFLSVAHGQPERWEARVVETGADGDGRRWTWQVLLPGELPLLRYPAVEYEPSEKFNAHVELRQRGGRGWFGRAPVNSTVGERDEPVPFQLVQYAAFGGYVVDDEGVPVIDAEIGLLQLSGSVVPPPNPQWRTVYSDEAGDFAFPQELEPGTYHLRLRAPGRAGIVLELDLVEGGLVGYELRVPALEIAGAVRGELRGSGEDSQPMAILSLRSIDGGGIRRVLHPRRVTSPFGTQQPIGGGLSFAFERVPAGRYELALFPLDGCVWQPFSKEVEPPADELVFECRDDGPRGSYRFVLLDADGAGELSRGQILFRTESWWNPEALHLESGAPIGGLPLDSPLSWMIYAPGYRPAYGALAESEGEGAERRFLVELEPGWGVELWLRDASGGGERSGLDTFAEMARVYQAAPVVGVQVLADGQPLGESDEHGRVRGSLDERPRKIYVRGAEWTVLDSESFQDGAIVDTEAAERRSVVLWLSPKN